MTMKQKIRHLATLLLDDENGISPAAYVQLVDVLKDFNINDLPEVKLIEDRYLFPESAW